MTSGHLDSQGVYGPLAVWSLEEVQEIVHTCQKVGAFCFDVETVGILDHHPDVMGLMEIELAQHLATLKSSSLAIVQSSTETFKDKYRSRIALDPKRNDVIWLGIATTGRSWAIPFKHPRGELLTPEEVGDGTTVPPPGYRKTLPSGKESMAKSRYRIPATFTDPPQQLSRTEVLEVLRPLFFSTEIIKIGHNVKFDARSIAKYYGEVPPGPYHDTMLLQHVVNENLTSYSLETLIGYNFERHEAYREGKLGKVISNVSFDAAARYLHLDVRWAWLLWHRLYKKIVNKGRLSEAMELDVQVLRVLMDMEQEGIPVDFQAMKSLEKEFDKQLLDIRSNISGVTYPGFNPDSTLDKRNFLFGPKSEGGLGIKPVKTTTKGLASTDADSLEQLVAVHPIVPMILEWQTIKKLKSTYVDGLLVQLNNGRLHPSFHLHRTATGRMASSSPNLQNIPRDSTIRSLFTAVQGYELLVADYDQIELRVMAMFSQDSEMLKVFRNGIDIHRGAAALIFDKDPVDITDEERQVGKGVNFLTAYGGGAAKLARTTGVSERRASEVIRRYYEGFSGLSSWKRKVVREAQKNGYVTTMSGRRRRLPDINHKSDELRSRAERQAVNAVVQGSAADLCKQAMIAVHNAFQGTDAHLLVQVHDELVVMSPLDKVEEYSYTLEKAMGDGNVINGVPLRASCHHAFSWSEAKGK